MNPTTATAQMGAGRRAGSRLAGSSSRRRDVAGRGAVSTRAIYRQTVARQGVRASFPVRRGCCIFAAPMCGICGLLSSTPSDTAPAQEAVRAMAAALAHRGPDNEGIVANGPMVLGHRRLSIIDLSPEANQPMANEDGTIWTVVNG